MAKLWQNDRFRAATLLVSPHIGKIFVAQLLDITLACFPNFRKKYWFLGFWQLVVAQKSRRRKLNYSRSIFEDITKSFRGDFGTTTNWKTAKGIVHISFIASGSLNMAPKTCFWLATSATIFEFYVVINFFNFFANSRYFTSTSRPRCYLVFLVRKKTVWLPLRVVGIV